MIGARNCNPRNNIIYIVYNQLCIIWMKVFEGLLSIASGTMHKIFIGWKIYEICDIYDIRTRTNTMTQTGWSTAPESSSTRKTRLIFIRSRLAVVTKDNLFRTTKYIIGSYIFRNLNILVQISQPRSIFGNTLDYWSIFGCHI